MPNKVSLLRLLGVMIYDLMLVFSLVFLLVLIFTIIGVEQKYIFFWLIILPASYFYFVYSWVNGGQTLGMKSWKVKIINANYKTASIRFFMAIISWLAFGLGYLYILFNKQKLSFHDKISSTYLVYLG